MKRWLRPGNRAPLCLITGAGNDDPRKHGLCPFYSPDGPFLLLNPYRGRKPSDNLSIGHPDGHDGRPDPLRPQRGCRDPAGIITKVLSLYIADEAIREGQATLRDPVKISRKAGRTGGSKMFLQAGSELPLEELLKGMAVVSANDASVAVAEYIGGGIEKFVERMNRKARELGI